VVNVVTHSQRRKTNYAMLHSGASVTNQAFVVLDVREYHDTTINKGIHERAKMNFFESK
jgi:hypothetical protein